MEYTSVKIIGVDIREGESDPCKMAAGRLHTKFNNWTNAKQNTEILSVNIVANDHGYIMTITFKKHGH